MEKVNRIGLDISTNMVNEITRRLNKLVATQLVENAGMYHQDRTITLLWINTTWVHKESHRTDTDLELPLSLVGLLEQFGIETEERIAKIIKGE